MSEIDDDEEPREPEDAAIAAACLVAGHMPWLPPTPAPFGVGVALPGDTHDSRAARWAVGRPSRWELR
jgi:hypothetical protein